MLRKETIIAVLGSPIAYYPIFAQVLGGIEPGIFASQFFYWYGKGHDPEGWVYKTQDNILEETGLTRRNQETARKRLRDIRVLEEKRMGVPAKLYYRLNLDVLFDMLNQAVSPDEPPPIVPIQTKDTSTSVPETDAGNVKGHTESAASKSTAIATDTEVGAVSLAIAENPVDVASEDEKEDVNGSTSQDGGIVHPRMAESYILDCTGPVQDGGIAHSSLAESYILECAIPPDKDGGIRQTLLYSTKTTTETTSENTTNTTTIRVNPDPARTRSDSVVVDVLADPARAWILDNFQEMLGEEREMTGADRAALVELVAYPEHTIRDAFDAARTWLKDPTRAPIHALGRWLVGTAKRKQEAEGRQGSRVKGKAQPEFDFDWAEYQAAMEERRQPTIVKPEDTIWQKVLDDLSLQFPRSTMDTWLVDTWLISAEEESYQVGTRTSQNRDWLQHRMAAHIQKTLSRVVGQKVQVEFQVAQMPRH